MVLHVDSGSSSPQRSVLADDVLAHLELGRKPQTLHITVRLGRVQAEQRVIPSPSFVRTLREVLDRYELVIWPSELSDDPAVDEFVCHTLGLPP